MKKRLISLALVMILAIGLLAGCGGGNPSANDGPDSTAPAGNNGDVPSGDPVELKMVMISMGLNLEDAGKVEDAMNEKLIAAINATVDIEWLDMGDFVNQLNLKLNRGDTIDVLPTFGAFFSMLYSQEALLSMNDLIETYGQGIKDAVGEDYLRAGMVNGELYAIPTVTSFAKSKSFYYRTDLAEQYNLDFSGVKTLEDLTPIFQKLHEQDPSLSIVVSNNPSDPMLDDFDWDALGGDDYGVLINAPDSTEVVNLFATEQYKSYVNLMHQWYQAGYIQADAATTSDNMSVLLRAGNAFGTIVKSYPGNTLNESVNCGYELGEVELIAPLSTTSEVVSSIMTIPVTSAHPEKAMELINLLYTDADLLNMLYYGIEGEHYQIVSADAGRVDYLDGENIMTCKYVNKLLIGNQLIAYIDGSKPDGINEDIRAFNENSLKSKALGFSYDSGAVANQLAALNTVSAKYRRGLECGSLDPETELPKFLDELQRAGIDDVIAQKQEQLNAWLGTNG